jgi:radical SAM enzyme (TIGR01210 family)
MNELTEFCKNLKQDFKPKIIDPTKPVRFWSEKDVLEDKVVDAFVIIFRTQGCSWSQEAGCTMCGYFNDSMWRNVSDKDLLKQFDKAMEKYSDEKFVKIFTSGSFLDDKELKPKIRTEILKKLSEQVDKISIESRPEYITNQKIKDMKNIVDSKTLEISIGLETSNDKVREHSISKGFTYTDYKKASEVVKKNNCKLKTYVLVKPPFLTEKEAIDDCINTVDKIKTFTDTVSFNPCNVQRNTVVEYLWKRKQYRPAWLWSVVDILERSNKIAKNVRLKCDIAGGGSIRGAHNCKNCDRSFLDAIADFSLNQNTEIFENLDCECKDKWLDQLDIEDLGFGSLVHMDGLKYYG